MNKPINRKILRGVRVIQYYVANEKLTSENLLSYQKFTEEDGSYFTLTYK